MSIFVKPVFFTESRKRWKGFTGTIRLCAFLLVLAAITAVIALLHGSATSLPKLVSQNEVYKKILNPETPFTLKTQPNKAFQRIRQHIGNKAVFEDKSALKVGSRHFPIRPVEHQIRAGFYVNWDLQSYYSLRDNIDKLNMVFPEWMFMAETGDTVALSVHQRALDVMRRQGISIIPVVSNLSNGQWNAAGAHRIMTSPEARTKFIASILKVLKEYRFNGVNIDFEDLVYEETDEHMIAFQKELYETLHTQGYIVTQDIAPFNEDYRISELQKYNDYLILMAYDQHFATTMPGPVADHKWVESAMEYLSRRIPSEKIILGLPTYGYDWPEGGNEGVDVSYQEALVTAKELGGKMSFDNNGYNLNFTYDDDNDHPHSVYFADAVTCFNAMRTAEDYGTAGTALWRLGGEDTRIWKFYSRNLSGESLRRSPFDTESLTSGSVSTDVGFEGEGDILDIVSSPKAGKISVEFDSTDMLISEQNYIQLPGSYLIRKFGKKEKQMVLTFDDGPDSRYTPEIMDILKKENVPASFFIVGLNAEDNVHILKELYENGYEIGNHTFTHPNLAETSRERSDLELNATRRLIECITGHSTVLFRPPFNADSEPETLQEIIPLELGKEHKYYTIGESIDPRDWEKNLPADSIVARVIDQKDLGNIILLHDAGGNRSETVKALPRIIRYFKEKGYTFTTIAGLMGRQRDDVMPPLTARKDIYLSYLNWTIVQTFYWAGQVVFSLFFIGIILSAGRMIIVGVLASLQRRRDRHALLSHEQPFVSVVIPAHNEEMNAVRTVENLLHSTYPYLEIIFVDDGSKDRTYALVQDAFAGNPRVQILSKPNGGKASALNLGIDHAQGGYVVCIDADTQLQPDALARLMEYCTDERVGAVAGNVKVGNERSFLTRWQALEYITSQNFDRRAFDLLNCITVVPGAIGVFRKKALQEVGGFTSDTLAEDCDVTIRLLRAGYTVRYSNKALALTEAPESFRMFLKQRFRWSFGIMQSLWKHRDALFNTEYGSLGMIALPNVLVFQFLLPLLSPLADLLMALALVGGFWQDTIAYYLLFLLIDAAGALTALNFERESIARLWLLLPQRLVYRQLLYWVLFKSILSALKGELIAWGVLHRTGNVVPAAGKL